MMGRIAYIPAVFVLLICLAGCDYRDIDTSYYDSAEICVLADWTGFPDDVTGMTVIFYPRQSCGDIVRTSTNDITCAKIYLPAGTYDAIVFNQSENEFGSMYFEGMDSFETACAILCEKELTWKPSTDGQYVGFEPEWLGVAVVKDFTVTRDMVQTVTTISVTPQNVVYTGQVNAAIEGANYCRSVRGVINGMAAAYYLGSGIVSSENVSHAFETWTMYREEDPNFATLTTLFRTFGLPGTVTSIDSKADGTSTLNRLNLTFKLVDDTTVCDYGFAVGDRITQSEETLSVFLSIGDGYNNPQDPGSDLNPDYAIKLPKVESSEKGAGFDASLEDWGDDIEIDIPLI